MSEDKKENIVYVLTKGAENPEIVLLTFMHAVGALTMEVEAKVVFMATRRQPGQERCGQTHKVRRPETAG